MAAKTVIQDEAPDRRAAALQATLELIAEQGLQSTPMSQVAQRANIGVGTIYRYFANKDDLINALYIDLKERIARTSLSAYSEDMPPREAFTSILRGAARYFLDNPQAFYFLEQYENSPQITAATREEGMRLAGPLKDIFERAGQAGLLKDLPVEVLGALMSGALIGLVKLHLSGGAGATGSTLDAGIDAIWDLVRR